MNAVLVSLEEYRNASYSPDREYVDGVVKEIHVGERPHSKVQSNCVFFLRQKYARLNVWPEQRVRTSANRTRLPDVCVTLEDPCIDVFDAAPFICIEILSRRDTLSEVLEKLEEYAAMGVPHIWLTDPHRRKTYVYRLGDLAAVERFEAQDPEVILSPDEIFRDL